MPKIIHFHRNYPDPQGSGSHHRIYQNYFDLTEVLSQTEVGVIPLYAERQREENQNNNIYFRLTNKFKCIKQVIRHKCNFVPLINGLLNERIRMANPFGNVSLELYIKYIAKHGKPKLCIVDYPCFLEIAYFNKKNNITTVYCPHNIETFTNFLKYNRNDGLNIRNALDWVAEIEMLNVCQERLMISPLETNILRGLGFSTTYYPYLPVSVIRSHFLQIRKERDSGKIDKKLFLMVGSIFHRPTGDSFRWLLRNVKEFGMPDDFKIVVGGKGGEILASEFEGVPGLIIKGFIEQQEFDSLLTRASGMLIPQKSGFGSLTRIPEMSCADIPIITSDYATSTLNSPPGLIVVSTEWSSWINAMQKVSTQPTINNYNDYEAWESKQPKPLKSIIERYL